MKRRRLLIFFKILKSTPTLVQAPANMLSKLMISCPFAFQSTFAKLMRWYPQKNKLRCGESESTRLNWPVCMI